MGYRGSKLNTTLFLKEQRADGSCCISMQLRCALMGLETGYQVKILSKQLTLNKTSISKLNRGLRPPIFSITLHSRDEYLLLQLQHYFGGIGSLIRQNNAVKYSVAGIKDLKRGRSP
jgi:hypothetical protein